MAQAFFCFLVFSLCWDIIGAKADEKFGWCFQEQPPFDKKQFLTQIKKFIKNLSEKLDEDQKEHFRKNIEGATKFLLSKIKDLQL
jgi:hypothetical protein